MTQTRSFPRPIVVISKCLGFDHCRYDGQMIETTFVPKLQEYVDFQPVCPEVEIGLGIPRTPIRVVETGGRRMLYQPASGQDFSVPMMAFVTGFLDGLGEVDGFVLKNRSPSCGQGDVKVYTGLDNSSRTMRGSGFFGGAILNRFPDAPVEDEGRLNNFTIREHFLIRLFTVARFREIRRSQSIHELIEFQTVNKLLFMGYHQAQMRLMGKIVANHAQTDVATVMAQYASHLHLALAKPPKAGAMINVLMHAFGGFSDVLTSDEKQFFLNSLEEYRDERIPLSVLLYTLRAWSLRHDNQYLLQQTFLRPYPEKLMEITDSGKGRDW
jgi:uncharacterized protein YbgA (DUF1722 family)/uncharacterized protein YbbK (DUF523 family)